MRNVQSDQGPIQNWSERFPELEELFSSHLVEAWSSVHASAADALAEGIEYRSENRLRAALREAEDLLGLGLSDGQLDHVLLYHLGSHCQPVGQTTAQWLEDVVSQLDQAVKSRIGEGGAAGTDLDR